MSTEKDTRIKINVFEEPTTYLEDFRAVKTPQRQYYFWPNDKFEPPQKLHPPFQYEDHEIFEKRLDDVYIPFNLLWEEKPIVGQNLHIPPPWAEEMVDTGLENAIKTRPRLYMSPAVSIDDTPEKKMRSLLCQYLYTTEWEAASKQAALKPTPKPPIKLGIQLVPDPRFKMDPNFSVPKEWIEEYKRSGGKHLTCKDPTLKPTVTCDRCKDIEIKPETVDNGNVEKPEQVTEQRQEQPELAKKPKLPVTHPLLTTYQVMTRNVEKDI